MQSPAERDKRAGGAWRGTDPRGQGSGICPGPHLLGDEEQASPELSASSLHCPALPAPAGPSPRVWAAAIVELRRWQLRLSRESTAREGAASRRQDPSCSQTGAGLKGHWLPRSLISRTSVWPSAQAISLRSSQCLPFRHHRYSRGSCPASVQSYGHTSRQDIRYLPTRSS